MAIISLFRIEHPVNECGPWQACLAESDEFPTLVQYKKVREFRDYLNGKLCMESFPSATTDFGFGFGADHLCACPSIDVLHMWFDTDQESVKQMVDAAGFKVIRIRIDASKVMKGRTGKQIAFKREDIKKVDILSIMDLTKANKKAKITPSTNPEPAVKKWTKDEIKQKLTTDTRWVIRGLLAIYDRQTADEKAVGATVEDNGVGFNGADAEILSSIAMNYKTRNFISPRQLEIVQKKMPKYAGQLAKIANGAV